MNQRLHWLLAGVVVALLVLVAEPAQSQERGRESSRDAREGRRHTSGSVGRPTQRQAAPVAERGRGRTQPTPAHRPQPVVLPQRRAAAVATPAPRRVTVIPRPERALRPVYHRAVVIDRPISRPTYRPIRWGTTVTRLPRHHRVVQFDTGTYFVADGVYYGRGPRASEYVVVRPPIGARVAYLPSDAIMVGIGRHTYYFYDDVWYDDTLTVVPCPYGGWVYALPYEYEVIEYGPERFYRVGGAVYEPGWRDGRSVYFRVEIDF